MNSLDGSKKSYDTKIKIAIAFESLIKNYRSVTY